MPFFSYSYPIPNLPPYLFEADLAVSIIPPQSFTAVPTVTGTAYLHWSKASTTDNSDNSLYTEVYRSADMTTWTKLATLSFQNYDYYSDNTGLINKTYYYQIRFIRTDFMSGVITTISDYAITKAIRLVSMLGFEPQDMYSNLFFQYLLKHLPGTRIYDSTPSAIFSSDVQYWQTTSRVTDSFKVMVDGSTVTTESEDSTALYAKRLIDFIVDKKHVTVQGQDLITGEMGEAIPVNSYLTHTFLMGYAVQFLYLYEKYLTVLATKYGDNSQIYAKGFTPTVSNRIDPLLADIYSSVGKLLRLEAPKATSSDQALVRYRTYLKSSFGNQDNTGLVKGIHTAVENVLGTTTATLMEYHKQHWFKTDRESKIYAQPYILETPITFTGTVTADDGSSSGWILLTGSAEGLQLGTTIIINSISYNVYSVIYSQTYVTINTMQHNDGAVGTPRAFSYETVPSPHYGSFARCSVDDLDNYHPNQLTHYNYYYVGIGDFSKACVGDTLISRTNTGTTPRVCHITKIYSSTKIEVDITYALNEYAFVYTDDSQFVTTPISYSTAPFGASNLIFTQTDAKYNLSLEYEFTSTENPTPTVLALGNSLENPYTYYFKTVIQSGVTTGNAVKALFNANPIASSILSVTNSGSGNGLAPLTTEMSEQPLRLHSRYINWEDTNINLYNHKYILQDKTSTVTGTDLCTMSVMISEYDPTRGLVSTTAPINPTDTTYKEALALSNIGTGNLLLEHDDAMLGASSSLGSLVYGNKRILFKVALTPSNMQWLINATLKIYVYSTPIAGILKLYRIKKKYDSTTVCWNSCESSNIAAGAVYWNGSAYVTAGTALPIVKSQWDSAGANGVEDSILLKEYSIPKIEMGAWVSLDVTDILKDIYKYESDYLDMGSDPENILETGFMLTADAYPNKSTILISGHNNSMFCPRIIWEKQSIGMYKVPVDKTLYHYIDGTLRYGRLQVRQSETEPISYVKTVNERILLQDIIYVDSITLIFISTNPVVLPIVGDRLYQPITGAAGIILSIDSSTIKTTITIKQELRHFSVGYPVHLISNGTLSTFGSPATIPPYSGNYAVKLSRVPVLNSIVRVYHTRTYSAYPVYPTNYPEYSPWEIDGEGFTPRFVSNVLGTQNTKITQDAEYADLIYLNTTNNPMSIGYVIVTYQYLYDYVLMGRTLSNGDSISDIQGSSRVANGAYFQSETDYLYKSELMLPAPIVQTSPYNVITGTAVFRTGITSTISGMFTNLKYGCEILFNNIVCTVNEIYSTSQIGLYYYTSLVPYLDQTLPFSYVPVASGFYSGNGIMFQYSPNLIGSMYSGGTYGDSFANISVGDKITINNITCTVLWKDPYSPNEIIEVDTEIILMTPYTYYYGGEFPTYETYLPDIYGVMVSGEYSDHNIGIVADAVKNVRRLDAPVDVFKYGINGHPYRFGQEYHTFFERS